MPVKVVRGEIPPGMPIGYLDPKFGHAIVEVAACLSNVDADWSLGGDAAEALGGVQITPDRVELFTNKDGADKIHTALAKYEPSELKLATRNLARDAVIEGVQYHIQTRSYYFQFQVNNVIVAVNGDLQFKVGDWEWGDVIDFVPSRFNLVGKRITIVPLYFTMDLYKGLGWNDRADLIKEAIKRISGHDAFGATH